MKGRAHELCERRSGVFFVFIPAKRGELLMYKCKLIREDRGDVSNSGAGGC